jgi:hypothetical protein
MTVEEEASANTGEAPAAPAQPQAARQPPATRPTIRGFLGCLAKAGLLLAVLAGLLFAWVVFQLQNAYPAPRGAPAAAVWTLGDVVLSAEHPVVTGRLTIEGSTIPTTGRVGVNALVPSFSGAMPGDGTTPPNTSLAPGMAITGPLVRLSATGSGEPSSCVAPCELELPSAFACNNGPCRMVVEISVELVSAGTAVSQLVTLEIAGGLTAGLDAQMPATLKAELNVDATSVPSGS